MFLPDSDLLFAFSKAVQAQCVENFKGIYVILFEKEYQVLKSSVEAVCRVHTSEALPDIESPMHDAGFYEMRLSPFDESCSFSGTVVTFIGDKIKDNLVTELPCEEVYERIQRVRNFVMEQNNIEAEAFLRDDEEGMEKAKQRRFIP